MVSAIQISSIFPPPTIDDVRALELPFLAVDQNPVTDWHPGAILRTMYEWESFVTQDLVGGTLNGVFANGYPDEATGDDQTTLAHGWYEIDREPPTFAIQTITLACDATHGPYPIAAGRLYKASNNAVYSGASGGTLDTSDTLSFDVSATSPGAARGLVNALVEQLPGVTVQTAAIKVIGGVGQFGSDEENDAALFTRMDARFEDLDAPVDPDADDRVVAWAKAAGTSTTRTRLDPDPAIPGAVIITLANPSGPVTGGEVTTVQAYLDARSFDIVTAQTATVEPVTAGGVVLYPAAWDATILAAKQALADAAWLAALSVNQIGGLVKLLTLLQVVEDLGAIDFTGLTLNGFGNDLVLAATQVPSAAGSLSTELTWRPF